VSAAAPLAPSMRPSFGCRAAGGAVHCALVAAIAPGVRAVSAAAPSRASRPGVLHRPELRLPRPALVAPSAAPEFHRPEARLPRCWHPPPGPGVVLPWRRARGLRSPRLLRRTPEARIATQPGAPGLSPRDWAKRRAVLWSAPASRWRGNRGAAAEPRARGDHQRRGGARAAPGQAAEARARWSPPGHGGQASGPWREAPGRGSRSSGAVEAPGHGEGHPGTAAEARRVAGDGSTAGPSGGRAPGDGRRSSGARKAHTGRTSPVRSRRGGPVDPRSRLVLPLVGPACYLMVYPPRSTAGLFVYPLSQPARCPCRTPTMRAG